jgi:hypothetical protein
MTHLKNDRFPIGAYSKLKYKKTCLSEILRKFFNNAYKLNFPKAFDTYPIFNISYLCEFHEREDDGKVSTL